MDIWIFCSLSLYVMEYFRCFDVIDGFHGTDKLRLDRRKFLLHQAVYINYPPGIFSVAKARHLCDERPRGVYATPSQHLQSFLWGKESILFAERID
jgi:hypothetical protein